MGNIVLKCGRVALVDDDQVERLSAHKWRYLQKGHTRAAITVIPGTVQRTTYMHRLVMGAGRGQMVDHINGDGLDNRRENLRFCTNGQNQMNRRVAVATSGFKGVTAHLQSPGKYSANIHVNGRKIYLGIFNDPVVAAAAYDEAAVRYFGEFAKTNAAIRGCAVKHG